MISTKFTARAFTSMREVAVMTAFQEVFYTVVLFGLFFIVIPVGVFTADLLKNYFKNQKSRRNFK